MATNMSKQTVMTNQVRSYMCSLEAESVSETESCDCARLKNGSTINKANSHRQFFLLNNFFTRVMIQILLGKIFVKVPKNSIFKGFERLLVAKSPIHVTK